MNVAVDIWSDIACPWCWIGKRNLAAALDRFEGAADVTWRAYELNPSARREPPQKVDYAARLAHKYGASREEAQGMIDRMVDAGRNAGVEMRFDRIQPSNTFDAHRLVAWAKTQGAGDALKERLFKAYLEEGVWLGDVDELARLAGEVELSPADARDVLQGDEFAGQVRADEEQARQLGIRGVPFFVFDGRLALSGAQPSEVLLDVLGRAAAGEGRDPGPAADSP